LEHKDIRGRTAGITGRCTHCSELEVVEAVVIENKPASLPVFDSATFSHTRNHSNSITKTIQQQQQQQQQLPLSL